MNGVKLTNLKKIPVLGGDVWHIIKKDDPTYFGFGEVYISWINKNVIKGWKKHMKMTLNLIVPKGEVKFVFVSKEKNNLYNEFIIGENNYCRITVKPGIWFAFQGLHNRRSLIIDFTNYSHNPNEVVNKKISEFNYKWT